MNEYKMASKNSGGTPIKKEPNSVDVLQELKRITLKRTKPPSNKEPFALINQNMLNISACEVDSALKIVQKVFRSLEFTYVKLKMVVI